MKLLKLISYIDYGLRILYLLDIVDVLQYTDPFVIKLDLVVYWSNCVFIGVWIGALLWQLLVYLEFKIKTKIW